MIDFWHDTLANGSQIRVMTPIDDDTLQALAVEVDFSLPTLRVLLVFDSIGWERGLPQTIRFDHGPKFTSLTILQLEAEHQVELNSLMPERQPKTASHIVFKLTENYRLVNTHTTKEIHVSE